MSISREPTIHTFERSELRALQLKCDDNEVFLNRLADMIYKNRATATVVCEMVNEFVGEHTKADSECEQDVQNDMFELGKSVYSEVWLKR